MALFSHRRTTFLLAISGGVLIWVYTRAPDIPPPQETQRQLPTVVPPAPPPSAVEPSPPATAEIEIPPDVSAASTAAPTPVTPPPSAAGVLPGSVTEIPAAPGDLAEDLNAVDATIHHFQTVHGENPSGSNAEITGALLGNNLKQIKLEIPTGSQVNGAGEMCDRWGTPYFFHQVSATQMEIRSAGPDRRMWTGDDSQL